MSRTARHSARLGLMSVVLVAVSLLTATSAHAVTWYSWVPTQAENVTTVADAELGSGILQIRRGTLNGTTYYWGRVSAPPSTYNSDHDLKFTVGGQCVNSSAGSVTKDIDRTTYTSAVKRNASCTYWAFVIKRSTGKTVTSTWYNA